MAIVTGEERIDDTGFGGIKVIQVKGLGYGVDAVLLAAFAAGETGAKAISAGSRVLDLGSGSGIVGYIILHKVDESTVVGIDKRESAVDRASRAAELNGLNDRIAFECSDICDFARDEKFDAVVSNPPYFKKGAAITNESDDKFTARHETTAGLKEFVQAASSVLEKGGDLYMVHRPDRLADIFSEMKAAGIEPKTMQMVTPHPGESANIVLVHGVKGAGSELKVLPEIAVHNTDGSYTDIIEKIYERM